MNFIPKITEEKEFMLDRIKVKSTDDLFIDIPDKILLKEKLNLPSSLTESEVKKKITNLANKNRQYQPSFLGAGSYNHYIPSVVSHITGRSEFYTAYTPYQPEMSQGILQAIFEYQTMVCNLTGMGVANASVYDGAEALAEAATICINKTKRNKIIISKAVNPEYKKTVKTYLNARGNELIEVDYDKTGSIDFEKLKKTINDDIAGILIQSPNFFGIIEDIEKIEKICHENNSLLATAISDPTCLGIIKSPGELGSDIVAAEGQAFGNPRSYGGPLLGILAVKETLMRNLPGRIVGETIDKDGEKGYLLTLQAREQHIRREKASCNICSNQALNALAATVYLAALGKSGFSKLAQSNLQKSHYALKEFEKIGINPKFSNHFYNEFVIEFKDTKTIEKIDTKLEELNIESGYKLDKYFYELKNCVLFCITEMISKEDIDNLINVIKKC